MKINKNLGLYIHIPFCKSKCNYCDFSSFSNLGEDVVTQYLSTLKQEIISQGEIYGKEFFVDTIFFGGGTPSFLESVQIAELKDAIYAHFQVIDDAEITIEVNPGTVDLYKLEDYKKMGINRLSIGVQSMNDENLQFLGRIHNASTAKNTFLLARKAGFENISMDMMLALPNQDIISFKEDIEKFIYLTPEHISCYSLQYEEGTPLFESLENGEFEQLPDDLDRNIYHLACEMLTSAGYQQYEISNFAKRGFESKHNLKYWSMDDYLGLGLDAHSYINGERFANPHTFTEYEKGDNREYSKVDYYSEYMFTGLRKLSGVPLSEVYKKSGADITVEKLIEKGLVEIVDDNLRLTKLGIDLSNQVFVEFMPDN